tara:strand:- start:159 stop:668 length:510 start_codon:yes stop_codon:yes gene_type:complete
MSAIKFQVGEPRNVTLAFNSPKEGDNQYGRWYLYGIKSDINSDEDGFFATETLHTMIKTLGAGEGDEVIIEKCQDGDKFFYKVNGLSIHDMNNGGSAAKIEAAKPNPLKESLEVDLDYSIGKLSADFIRLKSEFAKLEDSFKQLDSKISNENQTVEEDEVKYDVNDIPF